MRVPGFRVVLSLPISSSPVQGKIVAQGRLLLQDTFMVGDHDGGPLSRMKERRVFLFEQIVIFSEPLDKKRGFSMPGFLYKNSIKVRRRCPLHTKSNSAKSSGHVSSMGSDHV